MDENEYSIIDILKRRRYDESCMLLVKLHSRERLLSFQLVPLRVQYFMLSVAEMFRL